jgi:hypothetical protein
MSLIFPQDLLEQLAGKLHYSDEGPVKPGSAVEFLFAGGKSRV